MVTKPGVQKQHIKASFSTNADRTEIVATFTEDLDPSGSNLALVDAAGKVVAKGGTVDATNKKITTVEGLGTPENPNAVQSAFVENDALMCGFCTPGFVTTISAYLKKNPNPSLADVREACKGNFCRCGTYPRVFEAALAAAKGSQA